MYRDNVTKIEDFAEMTERYNTTKPVVSKNHTKEDNIRPVGKRSRKHEHMVKISARQYLIYDGYCWGDPHFGWNNNNKPTTKETIDLAPIMWTLSPKGDIETIRIRNGSGNYAHCGRYSFLENTLPTGLEFLVEHGKQYIYRATHTTNLGTRYFLPKSAYTLLYHADNIYTRTNTKVPTRFLPKDDKKYLTFARKVGGDTYSWEIIGDTWDISPARKRVDTKRKAKIKPITDKFYKWLDIHHVFVMPEFKGYSERYEYISKHYESLYKAGLSHRSGYYRYDETEEIKDTKMQDRILKIMNADTHPLKYTVGVLLLSQINFERLDYNSSRIRTKYNRIINRMFSLLKEVKPKKIYKVKGENV